MAWFAQYASMIAFIVQLAFYLVVGASALWAAITFSRYVKFMTTEEIEDETGEPAEGASVEEFVE